MTTMMSFSFAFAASNKVCFGSTKDHASQGLVMLASISQENVSLKTIKENNFQDAYNGVFPSYSRSVAGKDGHSYLTYKGQDSDYQDVILVDSALLSDGGTGLLQIRGRGEGFSNTVYFCKDAK